MNCNNQACLFQIDGSCTSEPHNVQPSRAVINCCSKFMEQGLQKGNEFDSVFNFDPVGGLHLTDKEYNQYCLDLSKIRTIMHNRTL